MKPASHATSLLVILGFGVAPLFGQQRAVAITVDDLPYASGGVDQANATLAAEINDKLLAAFKAYDVPATGFVVQAGVDVFGKAGIAMLEQWVGQGLDLGNHSYSHPDFNLLTVEQIEQEIIKGESSIAPLMEQAGKKLSDFRFPQNHTGDTKAKHDAIAEFLAKRGYEVATCTIENSDWIFNEAYVHMLAKHDESSAQRLRDDYLAYTAAEIDYYAALNRQVLGYEPPQVMLLHINRLNADVIEPLLTLFRQRDYKFVTLAEAQSDPAYKTPDTYVTKFGPMWGYRWAAVRNVKVDGSLEPEPPQWILDYTKK